MRERLVTYHSAHAINYQILQNLKSSYFRNIVKGKRDQAIYENIPSLTVFMAFTIEGYINSVGFRFCNDWVEKASWKNKIKKLREINPATFKQDNSIEQFIENIFKFRDDLAHGKPKVERGPWLKVGTLPANLERVVGTPNPIINFTRLSFLEKALHSFEEILSYIGSMAGLDASDITIAYRMELEPEKDAEAL